MKELTKSEEQMMDIFWDSKEALTSVDIVKMQVKATWTNGLVHNIIRSLVQNGYLKECGMEQFGRQYARKLMPALTREEYIAKLMIQKTAYDVAVLPVEEPILRTMPLVMKDRRGLSTAAKTLMQFILKDRVE